MAQHNTKPKVIDIAAVKDVQDAQELDTGVPSTEIVGEMLPVDIKTRKKLEQFLEKELDRLEDYFEKIQKPEKKVQLIVQLLPYVTPKMSEKTVSNSIDVTVLNAIKRLSTGAEAPEHGPGTELPKAGDDDPLSGMDVIRDEEA